MSAMASRRDKAVVAVSGGVDSAVAAWRLREAGYDVSALHLRRGPAAPPGRPGHAADAARVAEALGIDLTIEDAEADFADLIDDFAAEYARGRTPNPCVRCNARIKFPHLLARADRIGARFVATGHHARLAGGAIRRAAEKDQSYALFALDRAVLVRILLPVGEMADKAEVRRIAAALGLPVAEKPDSQEICFAGDDYPALLAARRPEALTPGDIVDSAGRVLGRHDGIGRYTIGQRRGLRVAAGVPMYVTRIDPAAGTVTLGPKAEVMSRRLAADDANWHADPPAVGEAFDAIVQVRYNHDGAPGRVRVTAPEAFEVEFGEPVAAVTPGQAAVVYDGERLLGGGWIR